MGLADVHIHSVYSFDGTSSIAAILKQAADKKKLNVIAITDHDSVRGNAEARDLAPQYGIDVISGCEVSTADGHLLALFIEKPVRAKRSVVDTVLEVADQGGVCVAAHPMAGGMPSLKFDALWRVVNHPEACKTLVGVEVFNGSLLRSHSNTLTAAMTACMPLARLGNSDAHVLSTIGCGATEFPGETAADFRKALIERTTRVHYEKKLSGAFIIGSYLPRFLLRKLGWIAWNSHPHEPIRLARPGKWFFDALREPAV